MPLMERIEKFLPGLFETFFLSSEQHLDLVWFQPQPVTFNCDLSTLPYLAQRHKGVRSVKNGAPFNVSSWVSRETGGEHQIAHVRKKQYSKMIPILRTKSKQKVAT